MTFFESIILRFTAVLEIQLKPLRIASNIFKTSVFSFRGVVTGLTFYGYPIALLIRNSSFFPSSPPHQKQNSSLLSTPPPNHIYEG
jgi:hypothetical protein